MTLTEADYYSLQREMREAMQQVAATRGITLCFDDSFLEWLESHFDIGEA